jgi:hypothetical protein
MAGNTSIVTVSDVDLKEGVPQSESWCALAVSIRKEVEASLNDEIEVNAAYVRVVLGHGRWWAETTADLTEFIRRFDATADDEGAQDPEKLTALMARASAGLLAFPLTWTEGDPPEWEDGGF